MEGWASAEWTYEVDLSSVCECLWPNLAGLTRMQAISALTVTQVLLGMLPWEARRGLDQALPARLALPAGRSAAIDYARDVPTLEARAQHLFGLATLPMLAGGRVPLQVALLSPAGRPIAITGDLAAFWAGSWAEVRKEMRGRYPKHAWPENPAREQG